LILAILDRGFLDMTGRFGRRLRKTESTLCLKVLDHNAELAKIIQRVCDRAIKIE
jgi:hypothetical protein